jgi:hypothetical protein
MCALIFSSGVKITLSLGCLNVMEWKVRVCVIVVKIVDNMWNFLFCLLCIRRLKNDVQQVDLAFIYYCLVVSLI